MKKTKVIFVCMGNICRSPTAEGVFAKLIKEKKVDHQFDIDSAGTHAYHVGDPPDERAQKAALNRGIDLRNIRARQVGHSDFETFDHILVMDRQNLDTLMFVCPRTHSQKVKLFMEYASGIKVKEVPDPYYGGDKGFDHVLDLVERASLGFLNSVRHTLRG